MAISIPMNTKILLSCLVLTTVMHADQPAPESFIAPPKLKKESDTAIKEACGSLMLTNDKKSAYLHIATADLQKTLIDHEIILVNQDKNSFFVMANNQQLQAYRAVQEKISKSLDTFYNEIKKCTAELKQIVNQTMK